MLLQFNLKHTYSWIGLKNNLVMAAIPKIIKRRWESSQKGRPKKETHII